MMDDEAATPRPKRVTVHALHTWGVAELREYIDDLQAEIVRAKAAIDHKQGSRQAAEAFFKLPGGSS